MYENKTSLGDVMKKVNKLIMLLLLVTIVGQPLGLSASQVGSALSENSASELVLSETSSEKKQSSITEPHNGSEAGVESSVKTQVTPQSSESNSEENSEKSEETQRTNQEKPTISGVNNIEVAYDSDFDVKKGITAKAGNGQNITNLIKFPGEVDTKNAGHVYELSYSVTDPSNEQVTTVNRKVTVGTTKDTVENGVYKREIYKGYNLVQRKYYYGNSYDDTHIKEQQVYYSNGKMKLKKRYNQNRKCTSIEAWNSSGIRTDTKKYDGKDSKPVVQYYYHTKGKVKTKYVYYKTGSSKYTRNDYNTDGKITKSTRYYTNNKRQFYKEYFTNGRVKKATYYNTSGKFTSVESWNGSGKRTKTQKYNGKGFKTVEYHYHENGKVKYTYYKSGVVKYIRVDYNQTGVKTAFTKYDRKNNTLFKKHSFQMVK